MNNSTFLIFFVILFSMMSIIKGYAQHNPEKVTIIPNSKKSDAKTIKGDIIWSEDFSGGLPNDWLNMNLNGFCAFSYSDQGPQGPLSAGIPAINSFTPENGFMILDSDLCNADNNNYLFTDAFLQTPAISLTGLEQLPNVLYFTHNFRYCCSSAETQINVQVSTDSLNWNVFDVKNGVPANTISPNAVYQSIDLSEILEDAEQLWVRFHKSGASHYWWMIDDVMLLHAEPSEPFVSKIQAKRYYSKIPQGLQQDMEFSVSVANNGSTILNNLSLKTVVNQFLFESISPVQPQLFPLQEITFDTPEDFIAPAKGEYDIKMILLSGEEDSIQETNVATLPLEITDTVYSRSLAVYDPEVFIESTEQTAFTVANHFKLLNEMQATSVSVQLHENTQTGALLSIKLFYEDETGEYNEVYSTDNYSIAEDDIPEPGNDELSFVTIVFDQPFDMETGDYLVAVASENSGQTLALAGQNIGWYEPGVSFFLEEQVWQPLEFVPFIDLNFGDHHADCSPSYHKVINHDICNSGTGSVEFVPLTGSVPFEYNWEGFEEHSLPLRENLSTGKYFVQITDGYGCSHLDSATVENHEFEVNVETIDAVCNTGGEIMLHPVNGNEPFSFEWEHSEESGSHLTGLPSGVYSVLVTDSAGCSANLEVTLENDTVLPVDVMVQDAFCGEDNGSVELLPQGGVEPYGFLWENETITENLMTDLAPGSYAFEVSDAGNCVFSGNVTVSEENYDIDIQISKMDARCGLENGEATAIALNGHEPFQYEWYHGYTTQTVDGLAAGNYQVQITDQYGCVGKRSVFIDQAGSMPEVTLDTILPGICGEASGSIIVTPANPDDEYTYSLTALYNFADGEEEEENPTKDLNFQPNDDGAYVADSLGAGQYLLTVSDVSDGCELNLQIGLSDLEAPEIIAETGNVTCYMENDGFINVELVNASENAEFLWDDENTSQSASLNQLEPGTYNLKVTDNDCHAFGSYLITEPDLLHVQAQIEHIICSNTDPEGSIVLEAMGGMPPYEYDWNTGDSVNALIQIPGGDYQVIVTDSNDCSFSDQFFVEEADPIVISGGVVEITEEGESTGVIVIEVTGGAGDYTYNWSHGPQTPVITGLPLGEYSVTVTDKNNCHESETFIMTDVNVANTERKIPKVFPNPVKNSLYIEMGDGWNEQTEIIVYDIIGNAMKVEKTKDALQTYTIDTRRLKPGIYLLQLQSGDVLWQHKFLKQ